MIKKGLALQSSSLREDELELEVPPDLVAGRLGGAHSLQRISGRAPSPRGSSGSLGREAAGLGLPAPSRPGVFAVSVCVPGCAGRCAWPPVASYVFAPAARCASRFALLLRGSFGTGRSRRLWTGGSWGQVEHGTELFRKGVGISARPFSAHRLRERSFQRIESEVPNLCRAASATYLHHQHLQHSRIRLTRSLCCKKTRSKTPSRRY